MEEAACGKALGEAKELIRQFVIAGFYKNTY